MAVKLRLTRMGAKKAPFYRIVVMDGRKARDGQYIEQIGYYDPTKEPAVVKIDTEIAKNGSTTALNLPKPYVLCSRARALSKANSSRQSK